MFLHWCKSYFSPLNRGSNKGFFFPISFVRQHEADSQLGRRLNMSEPGSPSSQQSLQISSSHYRWPGLIIQACSGKIVKFCENRTKIWSKEDRKNKQNRRYCQQFQQLQIFDYPLLATLTMVYMSSYPSLLPVVTPSNTAAVTLKMEILIVSLEMKAGR